jgi:hypothetical protein
MKSVCLLTHRADTTRAAFRDYYETRHCVLGMRHFPFEKYLRNHIVESSREIDFDCVSEFYFGPRGTGAEIMSGAVGEIMRADERNFMDQSLIRPASALEQILAGPARDIAAPGSRRRMLMLNPADAAAGEAFFTAVAAWGLSLGAHDAVARVSMDRATPFAPGANAFPFAAILSLWLADGADVVLPATPPGIRLEVVLLTDVCESPREQIDALYGTG